jgi:hypothetical protein
MTTWHITILFQAPRDAVITDNAVGRIHDARPEFSTVSRLADNLLEFMVDADHHSSTTLFATACRRAAEASGDVVGLPVKFIRGEVVRYDHWLEQIDPDGKIRNEAQEVAILVGELARKAEGPSPTEQLQPPTKEGS